MLVLKENDDYVAPAENRHRFKIKYLGCGPAGPTSLIHWAEEVARAHDIKLFQSTWDTTDTEQMLSKVVKHNFFKWPKYVSDDARDGSHPGPANHQQIADICWDIINRI